MNYIASQNSKINDKATQQEQIYPETEAQKQFDQPEIKNVLSDQNKNEQQEQQNYQQNEKQVYMQIEQKNQFESFENFLNYSLLNQNDSLMTSESKPNVSIKSQTEKFNNQEYSIRKSYSPYKQQHLSKYMNEKNLLNKDICDIDIQLQKENNFSNKKITKIHSQSHKQLNHVKNIQKNLNEEDFKLRKFSYNQIAQIFEKPQHSIDNYIQNRNSNQISILTQQILSARNNVEINQVRSSSQQKYLKIPILDILKLKKKLAAIQFQQDQNNEFVPISELYRKKLETERNIINNSKALTQREVVDSKFIEKLQKNKDQRNHQTSQNQLKELRNLSIDQKISFLQSKDHIPSIFEHQNGPLKIKQADIQMQSSKISVKKLKILSLDPKHKTLFSKNIIRDALLQAQAFQQQFQIQNNEIVEIPSIYRAQENQQNEAFDKKQETQQSFKLSMNYNKSQSSEQSSSINEWLFLNQQRMKIKQNQIQINNLKLANALRIFQNQKQISDNQDDLATNNEVLNTNLQLISPKSPQKLINEQNNSQESNNKQLKPKYIQNEKIVGNPVILQTQQLEMFLNNLQNFNESQKQLLSFQNKQKDQIKDQNQEVQKIIIVPYNQQKLQKEMNKKKNIQQKKKIKIVERIPTIKSSPKYSPFKNTFTTELFDTKNVSSQKNVRIEPSISNKKQYEKKNENVQSFYNNQRQIIFQKTLQPQKHIETNKIQNQFMRKSQSPKRLKNKFKNKDLFSQKLFDQSMPLKLQEWQKSFQIQSKNSNIQKNQFNPKSYMESFYI